MAAPTADFESIIPHMKRGGLVATALASVITAKFGWAQGEDAIVSACLAGLLMLCTFIVGYSLVAAHQAFKRQMYVVGTCAMVLFGVSVTCEFVAHMGFNASSRDATSQLASMQTTAYEDNRGIVAALERDVTRLEAKHDWQKSYDPPESYDVRIKEAKEASDREAGRNGCATKCEKLKAAYASLTAERAIAKDRITVAEEIRKAKSDLAAAKASASKVQLGHSASASKDQIFAAMLTRNQKPGSDAVFWSGIGIISMLALFTISAGCLLNLIAFAFDAPATASGTMGKPPAFPSSHDLPNLQAPQIIHTRETVKPDPRYGEFFRDIDRALGGVSHA